MAKVGRWGINGTVRISRSAALTFSVGFAHGFIAILMTGRRASLVELYSPT